jgi:putative ABC transport system permease protein
MDIEIASEERLLQCLRRTKGREFTVQDMEEARPVAVVNTFLAERYWPDEDPIGQRVGFPGSDTRYEVVGVVGDVAAQGVHMPMRTQLYTPLGSPAQSHMFLVVKGDQSHEAITVAVRQAVTRVDPNQPVYGVRAMDSYAERAIAQQRFAMVLLSVFAAIGLILACVGVYGLMAYAVAQRTQELGIRMALGADAGRVRRLVVGQGVRLAAIGVAVGLAGAFAVTRLLQGMLFEVHANDPGTFIAVPLLLGGVAIAASYIPARRATRVDPMVALRSE